MLRRKALFLDRDGIINVALIVANKPMAPRNLSEFQFTKGISNLIDRARQCGYMIFVATNQPDVARGDNLRENVEELHQHVLKHLAVDEIFVCYHDDRDGCECRKPKPGMINEAERKYHLDLSQSFMVGDRWRDILAGKSAGCRTIFVDYNYQESIPQEAVADYCVTCLDGVIEIFERS